MAARGGNIPPDALMGLRDRMRNDVVDGIVLEQLIDEKIKAAKQENINKTFKGMYSYMADANNFRLCDNGKTFPVAMQGNYLKLEQG